MAENLTVITPERRLEILEGVIAYAVSLIEGGHPGEAMCELERALYEWQIGSIDPISDFGMEIETAPF